MAEKQMCVAVYMAPAKADEASSQLQAGGSGMDPFSFVDRDAWMDMVSSRNAGERFLNRGKEMSAIELD